MYRAAFILIAGLATAELSHAQTTGPQPDSALAGLSQLQDRVSGRREIRVRTAAGDYDVLSHPTLASQGVLRFSPEDSGTDSLSLSDISEIQVRGNAACTGAIVGAAIFGGIFLTGGIAMTSDPWFDAGPKEVLALTLTGAALGALPGALIGAAVGKWKTVYRSEPRVRVAVAPDPQGGVGVAAIVRF